MPNIGARRKTSLANQVSSKESLQEIQCHLDKMLKISIDEATCTKHDLNNLKNPWDAQTCFGNNIACKDWWNGIPSIFKDSIVVYHEDEFPDPESPKNNELIFDIEDKANYKMYTPNNAIFDIQTVNFNKNSKYYNLTQVNKN